MTECSCLNDDYGAISSCPIHGAILTLDHVVDKVRALSEDLLETKIKLVEANKKIQESVFNCPSCGRHDFGLSSGLIKEACGPCKVKVEQVRDFIIDLQDSLIEISGATSLDDHRLREIKHQALNQLKLLSED